ncbi:Brp/Blh family beta-carotene 15,15'-dioxygenase [Haloarcula salinisoli]|uniref:Probable beta-carotene 15,15'-dioxygenase n=1 Tax=Haloarcula salinisoli TaxID=2487746 RepID=A0A8J7YAV2_9EURY|nr:Brp/Blh family beta-carotene 15,15'-dioxygenase [Halomicroarcula salinisoli]MBX0286350.1 Brp/Blh family beta-carotene 15,15'-dioxygenase [Halomicroarcula salinisoli]MBX0302162.1 Brp/Blh family beta-carotene 15,15'-dioxygenase [Halomicroarcula salinisoli]
MRGAAPVAHETLRPLVFVPGWVALAVVPFVAGLELSPVLQYVPLVASALLLGLPHGAVDHLAVARTRGRRPDLWAIGRVVALYTVVGGAYAVAWFLAPAVAFALFIFVTWFHWGQGDLYTLVVLADADHLRTPVQRLAVVVVRGGLPMLVPLLAFPEWYRRVAVTLVGRFAPDAVAALSPAFRPDVRLGLAIAYSAVVVATLSVGYARATDSAPWRLDAAETFGLVAFFALVPPVLAIGVYFCLWHSLRHIARLLLVDDAATAALGEGDSTAAFARFARDAAPLTLVSLALLAGLALLVPNPPETVPEWVGLYLVFIAVVTLPHVVVVTIMDGEQRIWA